MICKNCGMETPDESEFCCFCGDKIVKLPYCRSCNQELPEGARFCFICGSEIDPFEFELDYSQDFNERENVFDFKEKLGNSEIGDLVKYGEYEWIVLDSEDDKRLIITKDSVCEKEYNERNCETIWEDCTLRQWLNNDFFHEIYDDFSYNDESIIERSLISNTNNASNYCTTDGEDTLDYIFLLSIDEALKYSKYVLVENETDETDWWLRNVGGMYSGTAWCVNPYGRFQHGNDVGIPMGVRPAMWVEI